MPPFPTAASNCFPDVWDDPSATQRGYLMSRSLDVLCRRDGGMSELCQPVRSRIDGDCCQVRTPVPCFLDWRHHYVLYTHTHPPTHTFFGMFLNHVVSVDLMDLCKLDPGKLPPILHFGTFSWVGKDVSLGGSTLSLGPSCLEVIISALVPAHVGRSQSGMFPFWAWSLFLIVASLPVVLSPLFSCPSVRPWFLLAVCLSLLPPPFPSALFALCLALSLSLSLSSLCMHRLPRSPRFGSLVLLSDGGRVRAPTQLASHNPTVHYEM